MDGRTDRRAEGLLVNARGDRPSGFRVADVLERHARALRWLTALLCCAFTFGAGAAQAAGVTKFTAHHIRPLPWLKRAQGAVVRESHYLIMHWGQTDTATWGSPGVPVYIGTKADLVAMGQGPAVQMLLKHKAVGAHFCGTNGVAKKIVLFGIHAATAPLVSHEVMEALVDPDCTRFVNGHIAEVADPVVGHFYWDRTYRVYMADFVFPSYFRGGSFPYDYTHVLKHAAGTSAATGTYPQVEFDRLALGHRTYRPSASAGTWISTTKCLGCLLSHSYAVRMDPPCPQKNSEWKPLGSSWDRWFWGGRRRRLAELEACLV
jgi:hypothetical protein